VAVLLKIYAHCIDGQAAAANQRIADASAPRTPRNTPVTRATATPSPAAGHQAGQDCAADVAGQVSDGAGSDAGREDHLVAGVVQGDSEAGPVGVGARGGGGVGDRAADGLAGDQEGAGLLADAVGGAGAQDAAAEHGGLELEVGGLDFPAPHGKGR
jgi:hypothetical protein